MNLRMKLALMLATVGLGAAHAAPITVFANSPAPGDNFANAGGSNVGQAVGGSGWYYNNVRGGGAVGISDANPRSGNGSVSFASPTGAAKADIEFLANAVEIGGNYFAAGSLGLFSDFNGMQYDWYRDGASTNPAVQQPALRVLIDLDGNPLTNDRIGLVFERAYNALPTLANQWVTDVITGTTNLWTFGALGFEAGGFGISLNDWKADARLANAVVVGFSAGVGSGWNGSFVGAVDNIGWTFGDVSVSYNFEVERTDGTVSLPGTLVLAGLGLGLLAASRRRA